MLYMNFNHKLQLNTLKYCAIILIILDKRVYKALF